MPVFEDRSNRSRYSKDIKTPPREFPRGYQREPGSTTSTTMPDTLAEQVYRDKLAAMRYLPPEDQASFAESTGVGGDTRISSEGTLEMTPGTEEFAPGLPGEASKPEDEKPKPTPTKPNPTKPKKPKLVLSNQQMNPEDLIADLMAQIGFNPEEMEQTGTSRYNAVEESTPTLGIRGTPGDQWMGLLSALLEEKKRKEETTSMRSLGNGRY